MKKIILAILAGAGFTQAATTTMWVEGVDQAGGWYDANKTSASGDDLLCWAATASNLITWWQDKYTLPAGIPNTVDNIWGYYKNAVNADMGGDPLAAIQWWISGVYVPLTREEYERSVYGMGTSSVLPSFDGHYFNEYGLEYYDLHNFMNMDLRMASMNDITRIEDDLLYVVGKGCGVGLTITSDVETMGHAITLWGIEYEESTKEITKFWLTDSDDAQYGYNQGGLFSVNVTKENNKLYIHDNAMYRENRKVYVDGYVAIDPNESNSWGIPFATMAMAIPEPSTATLSLLALAGLAARRRR